MEHWIYIMLLALDTRVIKTQVNIFLEIEIFFFHQFYQYKCVWYFDMFDKIYVTRFV